MVSHWRGMFAVLMRLATSTDRLSASLLPGCDESSEEENKRSEYQHGKQGVVDPGHLRQEKVDIGGRSSFHVEIHVPRHEEYEGQASNEEPENQEER
jgi:hypothetical protein